MEKRKVFVPNKGCHDLTDAEMYGKLVFMSEGPISRYAVSKIYREFAYYLCDSQKDDYILVTGLTIMVSIACAIFSRMHGRLNFLIFKPSRTPGEKGKYIERIAMIDELLKGGDKDG